MLTFYQERLANESYLRTAIERVSLQEMGKLVGYRLRPGVAAETWLAFALDTPPAPPSNLPPEPGNFVTGIPASLTLDVGPRCRACPVRTRSRRPSSWWRRWPMRAPAWNAMLPWLARGLPVAIRRRARPGSTGVATNLKPGDALLFVGEEFFADDTSDNWDFRLLTAVEPDNDNKRTRVAWARGLGASQPQGAPAKHVSIFALRKRCGVFGNNAPLWRSMDTTFKTRLSGQ